MLLRFKRLSVYTDSLFAWFIFSRKLCALAMETKKYYSVNLDHFGSCCDVQAGASVHGCLSRV